MREGNKKLYQSIELSFGIVTMSETPRIGPPTPSSNRTLNCGEVSPLLLQTKSAKSMPVNVGRKVWMGESPPTLSYCVIGCGSFSWSMRKLVAVSALEDVSRKMASKQSILEFI